MGNRNSRFVHNQAYCNCSCKSTSKSTTAGHYLQSSGTIGVRCFTALVITIYPTLVLFITAQLWGEKKVKKMQIGNWREKGIWCFAWWLLDLGIRGFYPWFKMALLKNIAVSPRFLRVDLVGSLGLTEMNFLGGFLVNLDQSRSWVGWVPGQPVGPI